MNEQTDWDVLCEAGRLAAQQIDEGRWIIGDTALLVEKHYGENCIADYARECNLPKKRVQEYRTVCAHYEKSARADYLQQHPNITYSHMRAAMRYDDEITAWQMLDKASMNTWTVDQFMLEISEDLGKPKPTRVMLNINDAQAMATTILNNVAPERITELLTILASAVADRVQ